MAFTTTFNSTVSGSFFDLVSAFFASVGESMHRTSCVEQFSF